MSSPWTSIPALRSRSFSAKVFGGGEAASVLAALLGLGATRVLAAFLGLLPGGDTFFAGVVRAFLAIFFGFLDVAVRAPDFPFFFIFFDDMFNLPAE